MEAPYLIVRCRGCDHAHVVVVTPGGTDDVCDIIQCRCAKDGKTYEYATKDVLCYSLENSSIQ
jgi:hypothetical protein